MAARYWLMPVQYVQLSGVGFTLIALSVEIEPRERSSGLPAGSESKSGECMGVTLSTREFEVYSHGNQLGQPRVHRVRLLSLAAAANAARELLPHLPFEPMRWWF